MDPSPMTKALLSFPAATIMSEHLARQGNNEFGKFIHLAVHLDRPAMLLRNDVVADRQAKPGTLACGLSGEKRLEKFVAYVVWNACSIVAYKHLHAVRRGTGRYLQHRHEPGFRAAPSPSRGRVEAVAEQVQQHPRDILRRKFNRGDVL